MMTEDEFENKVASRVSLTLDLFDIFLTSKSEFKDFEVKININKLVQAIRDYFKRSENFKVIHNMTNGKFTNSAKRASLTMLSLSLNSPLYVDKFADEYPDEILFINEMFAVYMGLGHFEISRPCINEQLHSELIYLLHFEPPTLKSLIVMLNNIFRCDQDVITDMYANKAGV